MAKKLDSLLPVTEKAAMQYRQQLQWLRTEYEALPAIYQEKKEKALLKFSRQANKKLQPAAFDACDKARYAACQLEEKLQRYDAAARLSQRAVYHKAAKSVFLAVKNVENWDAAVQTMHAEAARLQAKRNAYAQKLEKERLAFLAAHPVTDGARYEAMKTRFQAQYDALSARLDGEFEKQIEKRQAFLQTRMDALSGKIARAKNRHCGGPRLQEGVILSVRKLKMYFGGLRAVDDLSFDVKKGEIFGLIGPNGAGKTTVFNCITQFYKPTDGQLLLQNREGETVSLTDYQVHDIVLQGIARTFQNLEVVKEVSVLENLLIAATRQYTSSLFTQMFHLPQLGREERVIRAKAERILKYMDLHTYRDRLSWGLPYGVLKRLEIARALMCDPQLIILDEPAAGLNESETRDLAELINRIRNDFDCTVLLVEHDMSLVMNVCDHICAISFGKKLACGTAAEIQSSREVQEAYLGTGGA